MTLKLVNYGTSLEDRLSLWIDFTIDEEENMLCELAGSFPLPTFFYNYVHFFNVLIKFYEYVADWLECSHSGHKTRVRISP